jgi:hypothetical protein
VTSTLNQEIPTAFNSGSSITPIVTGVIVSVIILTAALITMVIAIAIIRWKASPSKRRGKAERMVKSHDIVTKTNPHSTSRSQGEDMQLDQNVAYTIPVDINMCYGTTTPSMKPDATVEGVHQQQGMKLSQNEAYAATNVLVETNQCYGTTTPSVDPDQLYVRVEEEHHAPVKNDNTHTSQQKMEVEEDEYVIP